MPQPPISPAEHARHDELLVARFAAHDELPGDERSMAARLVAECPACASLSADLAIIARAVALEAVPGRRRDFRISADQAARLRGSRLQRLLRRLALPEPALLRPAAAGVMSLGLLLVVVGTVVPRDGASGVGPQPRPPAAAEALATPAADERSEEVAARASSKVSEPGELGDTAAREGGLGLDVEAFRAEPDDAVAASPMLAASAQDAIAESAPTLEMSQAAEGEQPLEESAGDLARDVREAAPGGAADTGTLLVVVGVVLAAGGLVALLAALLLRRLLGDPLIR